ncbi:10 kDa chaperonin, mitochondrial, partial [Glycine soja]
VDFCGFDPGFREQIEVGLTQSIVDESEVSPLDAVARIFNRVLVEKIVPPSKTNAGILLPEKSSKLNSEKVIAVGPGFHSKNGKLIPVAVKEGDTVLLPEYGELR